MDASLATTALQYLLLALVFLATLLLVLAGAAWLMSLTSPLRRRLAEVGATGAATLDPALPSDGFQLRVVAPLARRLLPEDDWRQSHLRTRLVRAGWRDPQALPLYLAAKLAFGLGLPLFTGIGLLASGWGASHLPAAGAIVALTALLGFFAPNLYVLHHIELRQQRIAESFPDGLDMLVVCVEAGLSLDAAIQRVSQELERSHPLLAEELSLVSLELRAGRSRDEALHGLADRSGVEDIRSFVSILVQTQHFGTSIGSALREQANDLRQVRMQRAREKANKLPVKLIFPIMAFIFPAMFLVILGPACIRIFVAIIQRGH